MKRGLCVRLCSHWTREPPQALLAPPRWHRPDAAVNGLWHNNFSSFSCYSLTEYFAQLILRPLFLPLCLHTLLNQLDNQGTSKVFAVAMRQFPSHELSQHIQGWLGRFRVRFRSTHVTLA